MDHEKKIERIKNHLENEPTDAQAQVALLQARSDQIEHERYELQMGKLKEIAYWRARLHEKSDGK